MLGPPLPTVSPLTLVAGFVAVALLWIAKSLAKRSREKLPPGPPRALLIGNTFQIPKHAPWTYYADLSKNYGTCGLTAYRGHIAYLSHD